MEYSRLIQKCIFCQSFHDIETAVKNNLKSVGCAYGYGNPDELKNADIIINDISELPEALEKLEGGH